MIIIFDLDDTLYDERQFVLSGFKAVAQMAAGEWQLNPQRSLKELTQLLDSQGRGRIFDSWLRTHGLYSKKHVQRCLSQYRGHKPEITLPEASKQLLENIGHPLYLVTDGNKQVQHSKIKALGIEHYFKKCYITHRYGIRHAKPSTYCFELIRKREACPWEKMVYVGDNPAKDFVNLNKLGMQTVRVLTGIHKDQPADHAHEAKHRIKRLSDIKALLRLMTSDCFMD